MLVDIVSVIISGVAWLISASAILIVKHSPPLSTRHLVRVHGIATRGYLLTHFVTIVRRTRHGCRKYHGINRTKDGEFLFLPDITDRPIMYPNNY